MALIGNRSSLLKSPGRFLAGGPVCVMRSAFNMHGMMRNAYQAYSPLSATPDGHLSPSAWVLPKTGGGMSSYNAARISFVATGSGAMGYPIDGSTSFSITFADAAGELISSGSGSASFTFDATGDIQAVLNAVGSASFAIDTNTPQLLALGWIQGTADMAYAATLTAYAVGNMVGSTEDTSTIVNANIVSVNGYSVTGNGQSGTEWGPA